MSKKSLSQFNIFDATMQRRHGGKPEIRFTFQNGKISFNKIASVFLGASQNDKWVFCQDKVKPDDWYLARHESGLVLHTNKANSCLFTQCRVIVDAMAKSLNINGDTKSFDIRIAEAEQESIEGLILYPLITMAVNMKN